MARITLADLSAKLDTIVVALDNHTERIAALESALTPARTASTKSKKAVAPKSIVSSAKQTTSIRKSASKQKQAVAPKSVKGVTTTSKKSNAKSKTSKKSYTDASITVTADPKGLSIKLDSNNRAAWKYVYKRICVGGTYGDGVISFADKKSYNAAVKGINALKGIVPQTAIAEFVANGWA